MRPNVESAAALLFFRTVLRQSFQHTYLESFIRLCSQELVEFGTVDLSVVFFAVLLDVTHYECWSGRRVWKKEGGVRRAEVKRGTEETRRGRGEENRAGQRRSKSERRIIGVSIKIGGQFPESRAQETVKFARGSCVANRDKQLGIPLELSSQVGERDAQGARVY